VIKETCKEEAITALRTTRGMIEAALRSGIGNFSLCHGLMGNAEVLLYGRQVLGKGLANESALACDVAKAGVEIYAERGLPWPCGTAFGETPNLMLGLAGIGHFFLCLHDPTIPSVLLLRREDFSSNQSKGGDEKEKSR
jgi:lantibiotic modifying enzyme